MTALIARQYVDGSKPDTANGVSVANFEIGTGNLWDCIQTLGVGVFSILAGTATLTQANAGLSMVDATAGNVIINLPAATAAIGALFQFKRVDNTANTVTINRAGGDTIDGLTSFALLGQYEFLEMKGDSVSAWRVLNTQANPARSRAIIGADGMPRCTGLNGTNNATTPLTKFDLSADAVTLKNATGGTITRYATATLTCDLGLAGPAANGRDTAAVFAASTWVYLYFIWNGTTLATVASLALPTVGPGLPSGYTHWCFATALRWNGSSNIPTCYARGSRVNYSNRVTLLSGVAALADTPLSTATAVPPNALVMMADMFFNNAATGTAQTAIIRLVTGNAFTTLDAIASAYALLSSQIPNVGQNIIYVMTAGTSTLTIYVTGYSIPNGDA